MDIRYCLSMIHLTLLFLVINQAVCQMDFTGHKLLAVVPTNDRELEYLRKLSENINVDTWNLPTGLNDKMRIHVHPETAKMIEKELKSKGIKFYTLADNLQELIDDEKEENPPDDAIAGRQDDFQLDAYHTFDAISTHLDFLETRYPGLAEVKEIGTTFEGNPIKGMKIGSPGTNKLALWLDCGMHAREWVSPATCLYIIEQLVKGYDTDPEIGAMVQKFDWYIFPVMNPDGYKFTWSFNRMWRKNRNPSFIMNPFCRGADPNRNFNASFGGPGTSNNPCSEIYRGPSPFSEAESQAVRDGVQSIGDSLKLYITIHSYSQLYMSPYGTSRDFPPDYEDHMNIMKAACDALEEVHGEHYKYGTISNIIYPAAGSSTDWAYAGAKIKYSFAIELRDTGKHGFILPRDQIIPTAEENFAAIKAMVKILETEYLQC